MVENSFRPLSSEPFPMNASLKSLRSLGAASLLAALTACGGGGGGSTTTPPVGGGGGGVTNPPVDVVNSSGTLQTSVAAPSYAASSAESSAYTALGVARQAAGAGLVAQSAELDVSAAAHAKYVTTNISTMTDLHAEDSTKLDYYAASPSARVAKAAYAGTFSTEVIGGTGASLQGADCVLGLLNTVYHGAALLSQSTHVGVGFGADGAGFPLCVMDLGVATGATYAQVAASGSMTAYPYGGQTNVMETFYVAYESPRPSATLFPNTTAGTPILVNVRNADYVNFQAAGTLAATVTAFNLKDAGGNMVPAAILANSALTGGTGVTLNADSNLTMGFAVLVPLSPLSKGVTYTAEFSATLKAGGTPMTKTWSFTTNP
jgi:hypothetical protein